MLPKFKLTFLLLLSAYTSPLLNAADNRYDSELKQRCVQHLKAEQDGLLVKLFKKKVPALYDTYRSINTKRQQISKKIDQLQQNRKVLHNQTATQIIDQKIESLKEYDQKLKKCVATLEERAYEQILIIYALQVAPESIDNNTRSFLDREIQDELQFAESIMNQVDNIDKQH